MKKAKNDGGLGVQKPTVDQIDTRLSTAEKLATEHHVSPATVKLAARLGEHDPWWRKINDANSQKLVKTPKNCATGEVSAIG